MNRSWMICAVWGLLTAPWAQGAVPPSVQKLSQQIAPKRIHEILNLPHQNSLQTLRQMGPHQWPTLEQIAFSSHESLRTRWRALILLSRLDQNQGGRAVQKASQSREWFMRNAAAVALPHLDPQTAKSIAKELLSDKSMVVRTAAVQSLSQMDARPLEELLWQKLHAPENFHRGESLFVRRHIAKLLSDIAKSGNEGMWIRLLKDKDDRLYPFAIKALHKVVSDKVTSPQEPLLKQRAQWINWWQARG